MKIEETTPMSNDVCSSLESAPFAQSAPLQEAQSPDSPESNTLESSGCEEIQSAQAEQSTVPQPAAALCEQPPTGTAPQSDVWPADVAPPPAVPITVTKLDQYFALIYIAVGYAFIQIFASGHFEFQLTLFTLLYPAVVLCYTFAHGKRPSVESWFWLGAMLCISIPFSYYTVLYALQFLALLAVAAYWTLCVTGALMDESGQKTSNWLLFDVLNAQLIVPYGNFAAHAKVLLRSVRKTKMGRTLLSVLLGVALAVPVFCWVLPLLSSADAGFAAMLEKFIAQFYENFYEFFVKFILSVPVTAFLFGLVYGGLYKRRTQCVKKTDVFQTQDALHFLPNVTIYTALTLLCAVYVLFIGLQGQYLFSAFWGTLPEGFTVSQYARTGFFELCRIAAINVSLLALVNTFARTPRKINAPLRVMNGVLSALSLLLLGTAASKMALYIARYGLTTKRVLTSVFLLWLAIVFVAMLVWQIRNFELVRLCTLSGAVLFCALCVVPVEQCIANYNGARIENGTLAVSDYDENSEAGTLDWMEEKG